MASKEELEIHDLWTKGYVIVKECLSPCHQSDYFLKFERNGLSAETIAAAFELPVEYVEHDLLKLAEGTALMQESYRLSEAWIEKNGTSPLLEGYDDSTVTHF